ncbi:hypothetical protein RRG08_046773 [Elysia crispata]|uniref:PiggyBac transposable element-derived protein domain-containing protein n=1 Tax=Elysia crispata TaxID=231223 RepID=A0AAE0ZW47_9GAST|nr:hypothetical protein RRG08_046773 [Elysia crispata]
MAHDRFLEIWTYLHAINEKDGTTDKTDKIYKVRPILNTLLEKFRYCYLPKQFLNLDEGMIPTKNRFAIKQYIKDKPIKFGIKSFILCEGDTGYIVASEIYTGKSDIEVQNLGVTGNVVLWLFKQGEASRKNHILVMDRYYNSVTLTKH